MAITVALAYVRTICVSVTVNTKGLKLNARWLVSHHVLETVWGVPSPCDKEVQASRVAMTGRFCSKALIVPSVLLEDVVPVALHVDEHERWSR